MLKDGRERDTEGDEPADVGTESRLVRTFATFKSHPVITALTTALLFVVFLGDMAGALDSLTSIYHRTVGANQAEIELLEALAPGSTIDRYEEQLGEKPSFVTSHRLPDNSDLKLRYIRDHIWERERVYVQAVTDDSGRVLFHSITLREGGLGLTCDIAAIGERVTLGETVFDDVLSDAAGATAFMQQRGRGLFLGVAYPSSGVTGYRTGALSLNGSGFTPEGSLSLASGTRSDIVTALFAIEDTRFTSENLGILQRSETFRSLTPNTCTEVTQGIALPGISPDGFYLGPPPGLVE